MTIAESGFLVYDKSNYILSPSAQGGFLGERYRIRMECKNCGSPIYEGDIFCSRCGTRVADETGDRAEVSAMTEETGDRAEASAMAEEAGELSQEKPEDDKVILGPERPGAGEIPPSIPEEKPSKYGNRFKKSAKGRSTALGGDRHKKLIPGVFIGVIGVVVLILVANSAKLVNSCHRNFSTPEEYYRWVEKRAIQKNAKMFAEYYVNHFVEYLHRYDRHISGEIRVVLGDAGRDRMEQAGLQVFEEGIFTFESDSRDSVTQDILGVEIGGEKLFSMDVIMDLRDEAVYLGFPGLTKTYLAMDTGEREFVRGFEHASGMTPEEYLESLELLEVLYRECPDKSQMEALANRYLGLLLNNVDDVKMRTGKTVRAGSITQACTTLEFSLDKDDIRNMLTEFLEELREDSEVETLLFQIFELAEELDLNVGDYGDAENLYEAFRDRIDGILTDMEYYVTYQNELNMTVYVDDKGQIIGRAIEFPNSWEEVSFSYVNPHRGSGFGYRGSIVMNGEELSVTGSGKEIVNKIDGSFTVKYEGNGIVDIDVRNFDMRSLRKGFMKGSFTVTASSGIDRVWDLDEAYSRLSDMALTIDVSTGRSSEKLSMELREEKELWGSLSIVSKTDSGRKISVPSTRSAVFVDSDRDFADWWDTVKWDGLLKKMNRAGLSSDAIDAVEEFSERDAGEIWDRVKDMIWSLP